MMSRPATTFGKRGQPAPSRRAAGPPRTASDPLETTESGVPLSVLAASLMQRSEDSETAIERRADGSVPYSWRAGILAGLAVSFLQAGMVIVEAKSQSASLSGVASLIGMSKQSMVPLAIAGSFLDSAQTVGFTVLVAHRILRRFAITDHASYALGGGAAAAAIAAFWLALGYGTPAHGWMIEIMSGLGAGFFYRVFAGANDKARKP